MMRSGNAVSSHGGLILFETVYEKRGGLICFDWFQDLPQVDLKSFLASDEVARGRLVSLEGLPDGVYTTAKRAAM